MEFDFNLPGLGKPRSSRPKRVAEAIKDELSTLLLRQVADPRLRGVSFSQVIVTPDLKQAKVYFVLPGGGDSKQAAKGLQRARGFFRSHLARSLNLRYTPELMFYYDRIHEEADRVDELLREIAEKQKEDEGRD